MHGSCPERKDDFLGKYRFAIISVDGQNWLKSLMEVEVVSLTFYLALILREMRRMSSVQDIISTSNIDYTTHACVFGACNFISLFLIDGFGLF